MRTTDMEPTLEGLLTRWTQVQRLSEAKSAAIHQSLLRSVQTALAELSYSWWRRLFQPCKSPLPLPSAAFLSALFTAANTGVPQQIKPPL